MQNTEQSAESQTGLFQILRPDGSLSISSSPITGSALLEAYAKMLLTRVLDEKLIALQRQGRMGTYVSCSGQEATQVGSMIALKETDWVFPMYRDLGIVIQRDVPLNLVLNKLFGNGEDESLGRDLPNSFGWRKQRIFNLAAPIGSHLQVAVGFAMAASFRADEAVTLSIFGDGATSSGEFHVSMNFAGVYKAQTVFLCENNQYAISVPVTRQTASKSIAIKARAYGFEGVRVDGNDLLAVISVTRDAVEKARRGDGPTLIECVTYRLGAHSTSDDWKKYRTLDEVEEWKRKDPLIRLRLYLLKQGQLTESADEKLRKELESKVNEGISMAEKIPPPPIESMITNVYAKVPQSLNLQLKDDLRA